ncbi:MAG: hypothetical protein ABI488_11915 [Polyangiaceae bacterium]
MIGQVIQYNGAAASIPMVNGTVNVPPGSGTIRYTATGPNGPETVDQAITVRAPSLLYGNNGITVSADGAIVNGVVNSGAGGQVSVGNDSTIGNLFSLSPVRLFDRSTTGVIQTSAGVTPGQNDHILGIIRTTPTLVSFPSLVASYTSVTAVNVAPDAKQTLAPGQFGKVTVNSRGQLTLSAGTYDFTGLDLEPQAHLVVPANVENVKIFVRDNIVYRGTTNLNNGASAPVYLGFTGTAPVILESPFVGTAVAPNATLTLQTVSAPHTGEFFAKQVNVSAHTIVNSNAFSCH